MQANGIAGALVADNGADDLPQGPVFMSEAWQELWAHVIRESTRLGIEISLNIQSGAGDPGNPNIANNNGLKKIVHAQTTVSGPGRVERQLPMPPASDIFYQDVAVQAFKIPDNQNENDLKSHEKFPPIPASAVLDLSANFKDGVLVWDVPDGDWRIIRHGMTATGKRNRYASRGYRGGLSYDQMHTRGIRAQFSDVAEPLIEIARQNGTSLKYLHSDSWEMGHCDWTFGFEDAFQQRRGYAMQPFLPVLAGHTVESAAISQRFLEDFRLTISDLIVEANYEIFHDLAHQHGIYLHSESAGPHQPPVDGLRVLAVNDIPMGEAWARANTHRREEQRRMQVALAASAANIYGKRFTAAEAPTTVGPDWERSPSEVKHVLDMRSSPCPMTSSCTCHCYGKSSSYCSRGWCWWAIHPSVLSG